MVRYGKASDFKRKASQSHSACPKCRQCHDYELREFASQYAAYYVTKNTSKAFRRFDDAIFDYLFKAVTR